MPPIVIMTSKVLSEKDFLLTLLSNYIIDILESGYTNN
jgi:hypothetical protein